jgi:hypothetical protein
MAEHEFRIDTRFSDRPNKYAKQMWALAAAAGIVLIILTMTTGISARLLPMEDKYLIALIPKASDGAEPLALKTLQHELKENQFTVSGTVQNRTEYTITGLQAVLDIHDKFSFTTQSVNIPLDPKDVPAGGLAAFQTTVMPASPPAGYAIRFQLINGPFVPHRDEHPLTPTPAPTESPAPNPPPGKSPLIVK